MMDLSINSLLAIGIVFIGFKVLWLGTASSKSASGNLPLYFSHRRFNWWVLSVETADRGSLLLRFGVFVGLDKPNNDDVPVGLGPLLLL